MSIQVKICGLTDTESVAATIDAGARYTGFVFYARSPRALTADKAAALIARVPASVTPVGLFVDAGDDEIVSTLRVAPLRALQLHGGETPARVAQIKSLTGLPVIKAVGIATSQDVLSVRPFESAADFLMLDAKPVATGLPGGNATAFDWMLLKNARFTRPWFLAGGLTEANLAEAVTVTGARMLDVSSGVEDMPGRKNPVKIRSFIAAAQQIETHS